MEKLKFMAKGQKLIRLEIKPIYSGVEIIWRLSLY